RIGWVTTSRPRSNNRGSPFAPYGDWTMPWVMTKREHWRERAIRARAKNLVGAVLAARLFAPRSPHGDVGGGAFGPKDYEDCAENAARDAKSKEALSILLYSCDSKFRGRRKPLRIRISIVQLRSPRTIGPQ